MKKAITVLTIIFIWTTQLEVVKAEEAEEVTFPALYKCCPEDEFFDLQTRSV